MEHIDRLKKKRRTTRGIVSKQIKRIEEFLGTKENDVRRLKQYQTDLNDKLGNLKEVDEQILEGLLDNNVDDDGREKEAEEAQEVRDKVLYCLSGVEQALLEIERKGKNVKSAQKGINSMASQSREIKVKLPKLEIKKFSGKVQDWSEFWDSFKSAIDNDPDLANIDKFKYLRSFLEELPRRVIAGLSLTEANYSSAVEILKERYAKPTVIKRAHINELVNMQPVFNERSQVRLKNFYDDVETHFRGLKALDVDQDTYSSIVVPVLMDKLPESIRLNMIRFGEGDHLEWDLEEMLEALKKEIDIRESHMSIFKVQNNPSHLQKPGTSSRTFSEQQKERIATASALFVKDGTERCVFCSSGEHKTDQCSYVVRPEERKKVLMKFARCFICLNKGHKSFNCQKRVKCRFCQGKHHYLICNVGSCSSAVVQDKQIDVLKAAAPTPSLSPTAASWVGTTVSSSKQRVALQTALAAVEGKKEGKLRVLFDTGSQRTFVSMRAVHRLDLKPIREESLSIKVIGRSEPETALRSIYEIPLLPLQGGRKVSVEAFLIEEISNIRNEHIEKVTKHYPHLQNLVFSDSSRQEDFLEIDLLIGSDYLWQFHEGQVIRGGQQEPVAVKTSLGWVISGPLRGEQLNSLSECKFVGFVADSMSPSRRAKNELEKNLSRLWDLDSLGIRVEDDVYVRTIDNIGFNGERYSVDLPWKVGHGPVPSNYQNALGRLKGQLKSLSKSPDILSEYDRIIREQADNGIIEQVTAMDTNDNVSYLPHHPVVRKDVETTKVRIVYDASCKDRESGVSLNDCLHTGPPLTPLMLDILLRFREKAIVLIGDIEKAFLNIEVSPDDRDYLRFLWVNNIHSIDKEIVTYRFKRVVFGVKSSPFLLNAVIHYHVNRYLQEDPEFVDCLEKGFFVDDFVTSYENSIEAFELYKKAKQRMSEGGFRLRKWKTNDEELATKIIENENVKEGSKVKGIGQENESAAVSTGLRAKTKVLGLTWDSEKDELLIDLKALLNKSCEVVPTKRSILSMLAAIFDPLGLVSPIMVTAKILFQDLCLSKCDWDQVLPQDKLGRWKEWLQGLDRIQNISTSRFMLHGCQGKVVKTSLHGFADASGKAYCATVYIVCETSEGTHSTLLCSKTRIAPLKSLSIPRLELMAARILVTLMNTVRKALSKQTKIDEVRYWSDSMTVLYWLQNKGEWKTFVQHRVNEILTSTQKQDWNHVASLDNPADLGSRGVSAMYLKESELWWKGPIWLRQGQSRWPKDFNIDESSEVSEERKQTVLATTVITERKGISQIIDIDRYSSYGKLLRVTAFTQRFVSNLQRKRNGEELNLDNLKLSEIKDAEATWIREAQSALKSSQDYSKYKEQLGIIESGGTLVCQGRLGNSELELSAKYPIILPREHRLTELIVWDVHEKVHHSKVKSTLEELRSRFWVTKGRQFVKKVIGKCFICRKLEGKPYSSRPMAPLPDSRVNAAPPFSKVGVDFAGPLYCKGHKGSMIKTYIALFTCCLTRAIHLELINELTTWSFLNCFKRFTSRRGTPSLVVSDNAKTFKAASKFFKKCGKDTGVNNFMNERKIDWRFNLAKTPWAGGMFERMIQSVKRCLRKVLGNSKLTQDELYSTLTEIEATINSRPLTYQYELGEALTPSHLLYGRRLSPFSLNVEANDISDTESEISHDSVTKRFLYLQRKLNSFWNRWSKEYLVELREHQRLKKTAPAVIEEGEVVLVQDEATKRCQWKLGLIEERITGKDGQVRGVLVRMCGKGKPQFITRPIQKLIPLEIGCVASEKEQVGRRSECKDRNVDAGRRNEHNDVRPRPVRAAAKNARCISRLMLDS